MFLSLDSPATLYHHAGLGRSYKEDERLVDLDGLQFKGGPAPGPEGGLMKCPVCGQDNAQTDAHCSKCSAILPPHCLSCGAPVPPGMELCDNCRVEVSQEFVTEREGAPASLRSAVAPSEVIEPRIRAPFVGRGAQLKELKRVFLEGRDQRTLNVVTMVGEPGVGKSRMALEFCRSVRAAFSDTRVLTSMAVGGGAPPYAPVVGLLLERLGIGQHEHPADAQEKIQACVAEVMPERFRDEVTHLLAHLVNYPFANSPVLEPLLEVPGQLEVRTFIATRRFVEKDAQRKPLLVHIDDVERAGIETVNLLHYLAEGLRACPVLILVTARPTLFRVHPRWGEGEFSHVRMDVGPLTREESAELFAKMIHNKQIPERLMQVARDRLEGSPRAIEDFTRYLLEKGQVTATTSRWKLTSEGLVALSLPRTHEEILRARLQALPEEERSTLEQAAAVGENFWLDSVVALDRSGGLETGDPDGPTLAEIAEAGEKGRNLVKERLRALCLKGILSVCPQSTIAGELQYRFAYPPLWDLAHELLGEEQVRAYHQMVAQWLELRPEGRLPQRMEEAGRHLQRAGDLMGATARFRRAGDAARARYQNDRAIRLYRRALSCVGEVDLAVRMHLWHDLGNVCQLKGELDLALDAFERMLRLSWVVASRAKGAVAFNKMGRVWRQKGNLELGLEYLERARELFNQVGDERGVATSLDDIAQTYWMLGRYEEALDRSAKALEMRRKLGDKRSIATSLSNIGNIEKDRGLFDEAESCYLESTQLRKEIGDRSGMVISLTNLGTLAFERGDLAGARDYWDDALTEAERIGAIPLQVVLLNKLSETALSMEKFSDARRGIERAMALANEIEDRRAYVEILRNLALVELKAGSPEMARKYCNEFLEISRASGMREMVGRAHMTMGEISVSAMTEEGGQPDPAQAVAAAGYFGKAIAVFRKMGNEAELAKALKRLGEHQLAMGQRGQARESFAQATEILDRLGMRQADEVRALLQQLDPA